ncbi:DUF2723 domain-containing protein [Balneolales bacterium ANBcel1]|nr:DUF2723 domain-containing protein [Balneolales bacterium ANBcel1]
MSTDHKTLNKFFAAAAFLIALILYVLTLPPTASFWDCSERIACAFGLQIPHPPGTPFYLLLGRFFSMFTGAESAAYMINLMSALASSTTIMLLYLIIVRFVREFKGYDVDTYPVIDRIGLYGGGLIGALTFAVSDSHWFTSIEAETYALSLTFTALVVWLVLKWSENHNALRNERWLLLITFLFGLAFGVHLLSLLAIFFVGLIIYFRKFEFEFRTFFIASAASIGIFFLIYPLTIIQLPALAGSFSNLTGDMLGPLAFFTLFAALLSYGIHYTHKKGHRTANILLLGYMLILVGYSTYSMIYIRSQVNPGIDQNSPDEVDSFIAYLKREQYGQQPLFRGASYNNEVGSIDRENPKLFPRRYSPDQRHQRKYSEYRSDLHFFLSYQVGHMYLRYFAWNFIGRDSDYQDAHWISGFGSSDFRDNPAHNRFFYLPFLLGLIGMFYHFRNDWKRALGVLVLFTATGLAIVAYLNQTPFQPRERDYSYTGSFFAYSIWIGLGATGIIELVKHYLKANKAAAYGSLFVLALAVPVLVGSQTYSNNDRSLRYVAPDYAYNLLNSTAPYAILFTNGDNDTFPLWYLQEVRGIRTDVRVVNLSLLNTEWYIKQMKNLWNYDSPPVPIDLTDAEVDRLGEKFNFRRSSDFHQPGDITIPVDADFLRRVYAGEEDFRWAPDGDIPEEMGFGVPLSDLDEEVTWHFEGTFLGRDQRGNDLYYTRIQDDMVLEILRTNRWVRPVYFSTTVARDGQMNLQNYFRLEGKAFRVVPFRTDNEIDTEIHGKRLKSFRLREVNNEAAYFDENIRRMMDNYRTIVIRQAAAFMRGGEPESAAYWLRWGEEKVPFSTIMGDPTSILNYAYRYAQVDVLDRALELAGMARTDLDRSFRRYMQNLNRLEDEIDQLERRISDRGASISSQRRRTMQNRLNGLMDDRQQLIRDLSYDSSRYMIIQRILYMNDMDEEAAEVAAFIAEVTDDRLPFPATRSENRQRVRSLFGDE